MIKTLTENRRLGRFALAAVMAGMVGFALTAPAQADDWHRGHDRDWHRWHHGWDRDPHVVYAPAPVIYAPPEPSPGINLILPLHFH